MTTAIERDITLDQGTTYKETYYARYNPTTPLDISGYDIRMDIKRTRSQTNPVFSLSLGSTTITNPDGGNDLIVSNGIDIVDAVNGEFSITLRPDQSADFSFTGDEIELVYDIELRVPGTLTVFKPFTGTFTITKEVTRAIY